MKKFDKTVKEINDLARIVAAKRDETGKYDFSICPEEQGRIWILLTKRYLINKNSPEQITISNETAFYEAIEESLKKYTVDRGDFLPCFITVWRSREKDENRKNKPGLISSLDQSYVNDENVSSPSELGDMIADDVESTAIYNCDLEINYKLIAAVCIEQKKTYSQSPKVCYLPLFFTDNIVYNVFNISNFDTIVQNNANKFDEAASLDFLNTLLTGKCASVTDIGNFDCRPLSDFTGKPSDSETPCCSDKPNYHVFNDYLKALNKDITQPAFSEAKNKYFSLISDKLGIDTPRKKKRV